MLIISNPYSGDKSGDKFLRETVVPLLERHGNGLVMDFKQTNGPGHAGELASDYLRSHGTGNIPIIMVSGGDTTIHEVFNGPGIATSSIKTKAEIILVPSGTANAMYHSLFPPSRVNEFLGGLREELINDLKAFPEEQGAKLYSVLHFLDNQRTRNLQSTRTRVVGPDGGVIHEVVSCVVVSTSLHASILDVAEELRAEHPGIERFKIAAGRSIRQWSQADVKIHYPYHIYDSSSQQFTLQTPPQDAADNPTRDVSIYSGPYAYFLTTTNVDRLEMQFRITPLATSLPVRDDEWMELLMIRPSRDPSFSSAGDWEGSEGIREQFAPKMMQILQGAYQDGAHVNMAYSATGGIVSDEKNTVVEYLRVREWTWLPKGTSSVAHLVCIDGQVLHIPAGGFVTAALLTGEDKADLSVYGGI
ncbi:hypothetical protein FRC20_002560 [Serendipita sp. 405]|nr:hypothetical protein FRC20_002560 [Serendipita sp. 405]